MATSPSSAFTSYRPDLRDTLMEFDLQADQEGFVGLKIAPAIEVGKVAGQYGKIELGELLKNRITDRANDGGYNRGDGKGTKDTYACEEHGFEERVDDREAAMFSEWWDAELLAAMRTRDAVLRNHNARVIAAALTTSTETAAGTVWSTVASSTPLTNVKAAKLAIRNRTGVSADQSFALVVDWEAFEHLKDSAQIIDRIKYAGIDNPNRDNVSAILLAQSLGIGEVIVSGSIKNTANEAQTPVLASMWDRTKALLFVRSSGMDLKRPQFMRTFHWGQDGSTIGGTFESYEDPTRRSQIVRHRMDTDEKIVYPETAQVITGVLA